MAKEKPILTISLLCSGRPETKKCLDSLKGLRERVSCELILVDTGCDEKVREILFVYADEVVPFVWCDDFAKARNAGLARARGKWFLYVDDDEYFIDTKEIEEFFLSGEYKKYGYAVYTIRNFFDEEKAEYQDAPVARLYSLKDGGRFRGRVHENFEPQSGPVKAFPCIAEHTGYIYKTPEDEKKHSVRNITLLEKEIAGRNMDAEDMIRLRAHLAEEYFAGKDYEKLRDFCQETLSLFAEQKGNEIDRHRGCFYCGEILAEMFLEKTEDAFEAYKKAVADKRNTGYCEAYLMSRGVELYWKRGEKKKACECCRRYLELQEYYRERPEQLFVEQTFFVINAFGDQTKSRVYSYQICLDLEQKDTGSLKKYFDDFGWENSQVYMTEGFMPCLVKAMAKLPYEEIFVHVAEVLANRPGMDNFWEEIEKIEGEAEVGQFVRIFSEIGVGIAGEIAVSLRKMLQAEREDDWEGFSDSLKEAVGICPMLGGLLKRYAGSYAERRMKMNEMQALAAQVKAQVRVLLSQGMRKEALQVLEQLKNLTPDDAELEELMQILNEQNSVTMKPVAE